METNWRLLLLDLHRIYVDLYLSTYSLYNNVEFYVEYHRVKILTCHTFHSAHSKQVSLTHQEILDFTGSHATRKFSGIRSLLESTYKYSSVP
jgi:hypothetical protein